MGLFIQSTISVSHVHWTIYSHNLSLKVVFLFQSFNVINVYLLKHQSAVYPSSTLPYASKKKYLAKLFSIMVGKVKKFEFSFANSFEILNKLRNREKDKKKFPFLTNPVIKSIFFPRNISLAF